MKYYNLDDLPVRWPDDDLPFILRRSGEWSRYYDMARFGREAQEIGKAEFDKLVEEFLASGEQ